MTKQLDLNVPRVLIAADRSSAGKTTISVGLMSILSKDGQAVQPFKVGLDYIDPSYHSDVTGRFSRNLDGYLMSKQAVVEIFSHASRGADIAIIEGVRGLYEGLESTSDVGSTAQIAKILRAPVILVIDARSITRSTAAIVQGYRSFDPRVHIEGVILNNIGSAKHATKAKEAIEHYTGVDVIGQIPRDDSMRLGMRHLGLVPAPEGLVRDQALRRQLENIEDSIRDHVDVEKVLEIARGAGPLPQVAPKAFVPPADGQTMHKAKVRVGVAFDETFNFYYHDLFDLFFLNAVDVAFFSPLHDRELPDVHGIYLGGGYPELFAHELERNRSMLSSLASSAQEGVPIFAECGGLMYLTESLENAGKTTKMVGVVPAKTNMIHKRVIGYVEGTTVRDTIIGQKGTRFRGHEFHYSELTDLSSKLDFAFKLQKGTGISEGRDGIQVQKTLASYCHVHPLSYPGLATAFIRSCTTFKDQRARSTQSL
ncbi:MAG TPA: Ni-sirohydrochlorin a,c-diamide synthase [Candidatus Bathyarchaeia archaeon]|nr:Ni-sirohydrochlorin a,c-diamide synthase [Candidatus Bathyarchaeia archaeon]